MVTRKTTLAIAALACAATACSSADYLYRPEQAATATVAGRPAARYEIPPESPRGEVEVAALGIAKLHPRGHEDVTVKAMHVRMIVANNNDTSTWTVDTREQLGEIEGDGASRPAFATTNVGAPPIAMVAPGQKATFDLYYPLPAGKQDASEVPKFDVLWHVRTPQREVAERTTFDRLRIEPPPARYAVGPYDPFWYDPFWPDYGFYGAVVLPPVFFETGGVRARPVPVPATRVR